VRIPPVDGFPTGVAEIAPDELSTRFSTRFETRRVYLFLQQLPMGTDLPRKGDAG